jgi:hypothetical protein
MLWQHVLSILRLIMIGARMTGKKIAWVAIAVVAAIVSVLVLHLHRLKSISMRQVLIEGAVVQSDPDVDNQRPIANVTVTASDGVASATTHSEASGYFKVILQKSVLSRRPVTVTFQHPSYEPFELSVHTGKHGLADQLYIVRMVSVPLKRAKANTPQTPATVVSNIRVRYTLNTRTETSVGSAVKTFQVINQGNVPCNHQWPCSPDGRWKAASASVSLDAGADNSFGNVRASCIAGPCPFTRINSSGFIHGGRSITVQAIDWSDTATFLMEAEVYHTAISSNVRELYPVIFGRTLNFTLPPTAEGVSLEGEINGSPMVFPLGPDLNLSWATCTDQTSTDQDKTIVYRCELKPGFRFQ